MLSVCAAACVCASAIFALDFAARSMYAARFFFFNDTATTEIYTLSLHDALPIYIIPAGDGQGRARGGGAEVFGRDDVDRKSTRLNSSHTVISYAVFCLKKKKSGRSRPDTPYAALAERARQRRAPTDRTPHGHCSQ